MIIILKRNADQEKVNVLRKELEGMGLSIHDSIGSESHIMGLVGDTKAVADVYKRQAPCPSTVLVNKKTRTHTLFIHVCK